jgi:hypothetical protein
MSGLSQNQIEFARKVRSLMERDRQEDPNCLSRSDLRQACIYSYPQLAEADSRVVAAYVNANFRSPNFNRFLGRDNVTELAILRAKVKKLVSDAEQVLAALDAIRN